MTAAEIRQKSFEKNFRGYDKDEVTAYLQSVAEAWDKLVLEKNELERRVENSEREAKKLKDVEESLFRTLKTAEDTGASIIEEANKASEEILAEAHQNANSMLQDAKNQSQYLVESAEAKAKEILNNLRADVNETLENYEKLIQQRVLILKNLEKLSADLEQSISDSNETFKKVNIQVHADLVEELQNNDSFTIAKIAEIHQKEELIYNTSNKLEAVSEQTAHSDLEDVPETMETEETVTSEEVYSEEAPIEEPRLDVEESKTEAEENKHKQNKEGSFFDNLD
ncbi:MAG: DivIVA domain-containing protein [Cyclobacteriaceae bacterium]|nr:DivIVA domain-containing protein [Cyclobacteriaceae bacterium]